MVRHAVCTIDLGWKFSRLIPYFEFLADHAFLARALKSFHHEHFREANREGAPVRGRTTGTAASKRPNHAWDDVRPIFTMLRNSIIQDDGYMLADAPNQGAGPCTRFPTAVHRLRLEIEKTPDAGTRR